MADISKPVGGENLTSTDFSAIIEMASEDFFVFLSVVFKKFGLIANEFLSVICLLVFHKYMNKMCGNPK